MIDQSHLLKNKEYLKLSVLLTWIAFIKVWCLFLELMCGSMHITCSTRMCVQTMWRPFTKSSTGQIYQRDMMLLNYNVLLNVKNRCLVWCEVVILCDKKFVIHVVVSRFNTVQDAVRKWSKRACMFGFQTRSLCALCSLSM